MLPNYKTNIWKQRDPKTTQKKIQVTDMKHFRNTEGKNNNR
jgi:hypothetical protein